MSKLGLGNGKFDVSATNSQRGQFLTPQDLPHTIFLRYSHSLSDFTGKPLEKGAPPDLPLPHSFFRTMNLGPAKVAPQYPALALLKIKI